VGFCSSVVSLYLTAGTNLQQSNCVRTGVLHCNTTNATVLRVNAIFFVVRLLMSFCHDQIDFKATIVADVYKYVSNADL